MAAPLTSADLAALTKVQARVKGWALRNKMRLARLEEAVAAGGPHAVFSLSPKDCGRLRDVFPCGLRSTSACGTLYVFDNHLAYHSEAAPAGVFSQARDEVKMIVPLSCVAHVAEKESYVTEPGVLVTLVTTKSAKTSATKVWWGGMYSPSLVVDALERALVDKKGDLRSSASVERARAARAMVKKADERDAVNRRVIERLAGEIAGYKFAARSAEADRDEARDRLRDALDALDASEREKEEIFENRKGANVVASDEEEKNTNDDSERRAARLVGALAEAKRRATRAERALAEHLARVAANEAKTFAIGTDAREREESDSFVSLSPTAETAAELDALRLSLDAARAECVASAARLEARERETQETRDVLDAVREQAREATARVSALNEEAASLRETLKRARAELASKTSALADADAARAGLEKAAKAEAAEAARLRAELEIHARRDAETRGGRARVVGAVERAGAGFPERRGDARGGDDASRDGR